MSSLMKCFTNCVLVSYSPALIVSPEVVQFRMVGCRGIVEAGNVLKYGMASLVVQMIL